MRERKVAFLTAVKVFQYGNCLTGALGFSSDHPDVVQNVSF